MDGSRFDARTVALALLCLVVIAFAAATLDTTTNPESGVGFGGGSGEDTGFEGTPTPDENAGADDDGRPSVINLDGGVPQICVTWLQRPLVQAGLVLVLVAIFLVGRWYDDAMMGLGLAFIVGYPGFLAFLLLTSCQSGSAGLLPNLSPVGNPQTGDSGGLFGGQGGTVTSPTLLTQLLLVLVVGLLGAVAVFVLTGDHDQLTPETAEGEAEDEPVEQRANVAAVGAAAGRAADRIEDGTDGAFENEVYRAWAEMTGPLSVDRPESSTPAEFAAAAVEAGMDRRDVDRLTGLFAEVRYGGADPTPDREREAVETLRRIESTYADGDGGDRA